MCVCQAGGLLSKGVKALKCYFILLRVRQHISTPAHSSNTGRGQQQHTLAPPAGRRFIAISLMNNQQQTVRRIKTVERSFQKADRSTLLRLPPEQCASMFQQVHTVHPHSQTYKQNQLPLRLSDCKPSSVCPSLLAYAWPRPLPHCPQERNMPVY